MTHDPVGDRIGTAVSGTFNLERWIIIAVLQLLRHMRRKMFVSKFFQCVYLCVCVSVLHNIHETLYNT